jgi:extradiol dioxygenase family protein
VIIGTDAGVEASLRSRVILCSPSKQLLLAQPSKSLLTTCNLPRSLSRETSIKWPDHDQPFALTDVSGLNMTISMPIRSGVLGHIVLNVADLKKSERFYRTVLGLKVSARNTRTKMTFLSYGREHHDVALMQLPKGAKAVSGNGVAKLHHFCIYVESNDEIDGLYPVHERFRLSAARRHWKWRVTARLVFSIRTEIA